MSCGTKYHWYKSESALRYSYCSVHCEIKGIGYSIDAFIKTQFIVKKKEEPVPEANIDDIAEAVKIIHEEDNDDGDYRELVPA